MGIRRRDLLAVVGGATVLGGCLETMPTRAHMGAPSEFFTVAHRGSMYLWPENTLEAIENSFEAGADMVEFDLDVTADGTIVVIHDETVDRTTDGSGPINELTLEEVKRLDAGYTFSRDVWDSDYREAPLDHEFLPPDEEFPFRGEGIEIPTLVEVLEAVDSSDRLLLDVKRKRPDPARIVELIEAYDRVETTLVGAFESTYLETIREKLPAVETVTSLGELRRFGMTTRASEHRFDPSGDYLWPPHDVVRESLVERAHRNGKSVMPWTVNDPAEMERLIDIGVDAIITDDHVLLDQVWESTRV